MARVAFNIIYGKFSVLINDKTDLILQF